jgi:glycosyl hydrolase family 43
VRPSFRPLIAAALATVAVAVVPAVAGAAPLQDSEANDFPFPGADTIALNDGSNQYGTFGASTGGWKVPWARHGSGNEVGSTSTVGGDALPNGGGAWAEPGSGIWTPGAFYKVKKGVGRYYLFYTATARNSGGRKCVGVAHSTQPFTGYLAEPKALVCPNKGNRWALDADVTVGAGSGVWMTWRDGQRAQGRESALSAMRLKFRKNGNVDRGSKPRVIMRSNGLVWAHHADDGVTVIENPSAFFNNGSWYLFYSGNNWKKNLYATGIAHCGPKLADGLCQQMPNNRVAWFAYAAPRNALPPDMRKYRLPGNKRGPGAMDVYRARDGQPWVTWNYLSDAGGRKSRTGRLLVTGGAGAAADFKVG